MDDTPVSTARALFPRGLRQPEDSYRFGADALLLAAFAADCLASLPGTTPRKVAELGSGCGAALLGLCLRLEAGEEDGPQRTCSNEPAATHRRDDAPAQAADAPAAQADARSPQAGAAPTPAHDGVGGMPGTQAPESSGQADAGVAAPQRAILHALGLELDTALCDAARENARQLGLDATCTFQQGDLADTHFVRALGENSFHLVLANPPYAQAGSGRPSASVRRDRALRDVRPLPESPPDDRSQSEGAHDARHLPEDLRRPAGPATSLPKKRPGAPADVLAVFCRAARRLLRHHGLFCCIFPADGLPRLLVALEREHLGCRRIWPLCPHAGEPAGRVLVLARKDAAPQCRLEPPLPLHDGTGWSPEALRFCPWLGAGHGAHATATGQEAPQTGRS